MCKSVSRNTVVRRFSLTLLVAAAVVFPGFASAGWLGDIMTENQAGQAFESGLATADGAIIVPSSGDPAGSPVLTGHGHVVLSITVGPADQSNGLQDEVVSLSGSFSIAFENTSSGHGIVRLTDLLRGGVVFEQEYIGGAEPNTTSSVLVELAGSFDCTGSCGGLQDGKLTFKLSVFD